MNDFIPKTGPDTGNYWCSWDTQFRANSPEDGKETVNLRNILTQEFLFGEKGMVSGYFHRVRRDLYVLLDDGWDVGWNVAGNGRVSVFGSLELNEDKFPDFKGQPWEKLAMLKEKVLQLGYRGLGLWICANAVGEHQEKMLSPEESEAYWKERAVWCRRAGVDYWKVDWGYHSGDIEYRDRMTAIVKAYAPDLKIEHADCRGPLDKEAENPEKLGRLLACSDYFRTYDVLKEFTYSTAIKRVCDLFGAAQKGRYGCKGILNVEDAPLLAAALGCSTGVMRHPSWGGGVTDVLDFGLKVNEVERALRWQRIAPPFGVFEAENCFSDEKLTDWTGRLDGPDADGWVKDIIPRGGVVQQEASAVLARNMEYPVITAVSGEKPFVACSRHPETGTVSIAFLPRTLGERKMITPHVNATIKLGAFRKPIGVFGEFETLTILLEEAAEGNIYLQDLCRDEAVNVTGLVAADRKRLVIPYEQLKRRGWLDNDPGDLSAPGFGLWHKG